jgi:pimeloyl-ACP methyl ester carboxylesterase
VAVSVLAAGNLRSADGAIAVETVAHLAVETKSAPCNADGLSGESGGVSAPAPLRQPRIADMNVTAESGQLQADSHQRDQEHFCVIRSEDTWKSLLPSRPLRGLPCSSVIRASQATLEEEISSWSYRHDRDLTGFIDGSENPTLPNLRSKIVMDGVGHCVQQERPVETSGALIDFLRLLPAA